MYTLIFRKGKFEVTFSTDDKSAVERQVEILVKQASAYALAHKNDAKIENVVEKPQNVENKSENIVEVQQPVIEQVTSLPEPEQEEQDPVTFNEKIEQVERQEEPQEQLQKEPVVQNFVPPRVESPVVEQPKEVFPDVVPTEIDIATSKPPVTINSLQNPQPAQEEETTDFDKILSKEMSQPVENKNLKDEKFIEYVETKGIIEKVDFLVVTAQYLAHYEGMNTFNLKHINAKLMQNFTMIVDHAVLQSAISRGDITKIQQGNDDISSEYMLTEKGLRSV